MVRIRYGDGTELTQILFVSFDTCLFPFRFVFGDASKKMVLDDLKVSSASGSYPKNRYPMMMAAIMPATSAASPQPMA